LIAPVNAPFDVTEELALQQLLGNRAAMDRQRSCRRPAAMAWCSGPRHQLFPVPLSPVMSTGAVDGPTRRISS
jgi:hypothetical protein